MYWQAEMELWSLEIYRLVFPKVLDKGNLNCYLIDLISLFNLSY